MDVKNDNDNDNDVFDGVKEGATARPGVPKLGHLVGLCLCPSRDVLVLGSSETVQWPVVSTLLN